MQDRYAHVTCNKWRVVRNYRPGNNEVQQEKHNTYYFSAPSVSRSEKRSASSTTSYSRCEIYIGKDVLKNFLSIDNILRTHMLYFIKTMVF